MLYDEKTESLRIGDGTTTNTMQKLPTWVVANKYPAFFDLESNTAIEQTARLYGAVNTLIENYNTFISVVEEEITTMVEQYALDNETHEVAVRQIMQDFFDSVETSLQLQDAKIEAIENSFVDNLSKTVTQAINDGKIKVNIEYNEETEEVNIVAD